MHGGVAAAASNESLFDSTEDLASGGSEGGSTIRAAMLGGETLEAASFRPGPSRAAISWALGGVGALLAGSVALALMPSAEPPKALEHEAAIVAPAFAPVPAEPVAPVAVAPVVVAPERGSAVVPLSSVSPSAETSLEGSDASTVARSSKASTSSKSASKSKRSKSSKRTRGTKKSRRAQTSKAVAASPAEEVEDDVLSQVQRYMREKKAREQRAHEAKRSEAERLEKEARKGPSSADLATASERLSLARKAYKSGRFSAAYSLASQSLVAHRSVDALELMVLASCARGDGDRARQLVGKISGTRRATVQARCREHGISL
ncbi:MAG TPA: hypothetical protein ENK31_06115 [Nannocystis exedens]|nr:hypothetical protein [Nannocystis exedens]